MDDIVAEYSEGVLRVELNRPAKLNAMTSSMYTKLADILREAAKDDGVRVVLWHGAGDSFSAGNDVEDFLKIAPSGPGESPQARLMNALVDFDKPLIAAVRGAAIGGGTTMLLHCDFIYAAESTRFQMPFINLALVPEFGSTCLAPTYIWTRPRGRAHSPGFAVRCQARCGVGICHAGRAGSESPGGGNRNCPDSGSETGRSAASLQETSEAYLPRTGQGGDEG